MRRRDSGQGATAPGGLSPTSVQRRPRGLCTSSSGRFWGSLLRLCKIGVTSGNWCEISFASKLFGQSYPGLLDGQRSLMTELKWDFTAALLSISLLECLNRSFLTFLQIVWVKPISQAFRDSPFSADQDIVARLVPEVITHWGALVPLLPVPLDLKGLSIQQNKAT